MAVTAYPLTWLVQGPSFQQGLLELSFKTRENSYFIDHSHQIQEEKMLFEARDTYWNVFEVQRRKFEVGRSRSGCWRLV